MVFWNSKEKKTLLIERSRGSLPPLTRWRGKAPPAYVVTQTTRCDGVEVWTREAPSLTPVPRLRRRGVQGGDAERPLLVGFQGVSEMTLGRFFFQAPPGFFLTKSKRNGVERLQVCLHRIQK